LDLKAPKNNPVFTGTLMAPNAAFSNISILGTTTTIDMDIISSSNIFIDNLGGAGPAISVKQNTAFGGDVAAFYDTVVSSSDPVFKVQAGGDSVFSCNVSVVGSLSANSLAIGGFTFAVNTVDATKLQINYGGSNVVEISLE
jgi:hypothetical protein